MSPRVIDIASATLEPLAPEKALGLVQAMEEICRRKRVVIARWTELGLATRPEVVEQVARAERVAADLRFGISQSPAGSPFFRVPEWGYMTESALRDLAELEREEAQLRGLTLDVAPHAQA